MAVSAHPRPLTARRSGSLSGIALVPGDKSISHRALILGALAVGETTITGLLEAEDVLNTAQAMRALGAKVARTDDGVWHVYGMGVGGFSQPSDMLDFGNSGTGCRLVMGALATTPVSAVFTGDASLRRRPMGRVLEPLKKFGADYSARKGGLLPVTLHGANPALGVECDVTVASAQVKSALLLAALNAAGRTTIRQPVLTRDHTEKMLRGFCAEVKVESLPGGGEAISVMGEAELKPCAIAVPRDPSSAAFPMVAALIVPGSRVVLPGILLNARRAGLIGVLQAMGGQIAITNRRQSSGEDIGDLEVCYSALRGIEVPPEFAPAMIDEYPVLAVAAAFAEGKTVLRGLEELRVKESDRLAAIAAGLRANGVKIEEMADGIAIEGGGSEGVPGGGQVITQMDHRIAMSFLVMGLASCHPVTVNDTAMIATSFPQFETTMGGLGADFKQAGDAV